MRAIAKGETSSCTNPLLEFYHQIDGFMIDLDSLSYEVYLVANNQKTLVKSTTVVDLTDCPVGQKLSTGRYVANLDPDAEGMDPGSYEVLWTYTSVAGGNSRKVAYPFEVLDLNAFYSGTMYRGYASSDALNAQFSSSIVQLQTSIDRASRYVEEITQRFFAPQYDKYFFSVPRESAAIWIDDPIIGVEKLEVDSGGVIPGATITTEVTLDNLRVFNRHLRGTFSPDDRENPKLMFAKVGIPSIFTEGRAVFPEGVKNMMVTGVFGYTDPDGGPFGETPKPLREVVLTLAARHLQDPLGIDLATQLPGRITEAQTRDQRVKFDTRGSKFDILTGDPKIDTILLKYRKPPHVGLAG